MKKKQLATVAIALFCMPFLSVAQSLNPVKLEIVVNKMVSKVQPSMVHITDYDTISKRTAPGGGSGVVVSEDGIILTVAHLVSPRGIYQVTFPDGKKFIAKGLGSINSLDAAIIKITDTGVFPHAEMGWSSSLKMNEPCFSIAYPGSFSPIIPVVRFGYITDLFNERWKMIKTSCLMEPGDSGGPLFDLYGRVIGVRSRIFVDLESNFEVPIDHFRKYWSALLREENYKSLPFADEIPIDGLDKTLKTDISSLRSEFSSIESSLDDYTAQLVDEDKQDKAVGLFVLKPHSLRDESKTFLITKSSLISETTMVLAKDKLLKTKIVWKDDKRDLALLAVQEKIGKSLDLEKLNAKYIAEAQLGKFLVSPHPTNDGEVSVVGSLTFDMGRLSWGYLGTSLALDGQKLLVSVVQASSPAEKSGLTVGDEVISIDDVKVGQAQEFVSKVIAHRPGEVIRIRHLRNGKELTTNVKLEERPISKDAHPADQFTDRKSERRDEFKNAFVHDGKLKPAECGGPLFDIKGNFMGINVARFSRTSSIALSPEEVREFLKDALRNWVLKSKPRLPTLISNN